MTVLASDIMDRSAALLSDPNKVTFTYTLQLPFLRIAWDELQEELVANGIEDVEEETTNAITVTAGAEDLAGNQPADLLFPSKLWERAVGGSDEDWDLMDEKEPDPADPKVGELEIWYWSEAKIKFRGATSDRQVMIQYQKELVAIAGESTALPVTNVKSFMSHRTAALIAEARGNAKRAASLHTRADYFLGKSTTTKVKDMQDEVVRPRRYGASRR